jgi:hypothetical protein
MSFPLVTFDDVVVFFVKHCVFVYHDPEFQR